MHVHDLNIVRVTRTSQDDDHSQPQEYSSLLAYICYITFMKNARIKRLEIMSSGRKCRAREISCDSRYELFYFKNLFKKISRSRRV